MNAHLLEAIRLHTEGDVSRAERVYREVLADDPDDAIALHHLGVIAIQNGHHAVAVEWISRSLKAQPKNAEALSNLGIALARLGRLEKAAEAYRRSLTLAPKAVGTLAGLGGVLRAMGDLDGALAALVRAAEAAPDHAGVLANLGALRIETGAPDIAELELRRAAELKPDDAAIWCNLGSALRDLGRRGAARDAYERALRLSPRHPDARQGLAYLDLADGSLEKFWRGYGLRWRTAANATPPRPFTQPQWKGQDLAGKSLLIWGEQGVGDEIMFSALIPEIAPRAARCLVETDSRLVPLLARSYPGIDFFARQNPADPRLLDPAIAYHVAMGDLARALRPSLDPFRPLGSHLRPDPARSAAFRDSYRNLGSGPVVGIAWHSRHPRQGRRVSAPLAQWGPIFKRPDTVFVSLQYGQNNSEIAAAESEFGTVLHRDSSFDPMTDLDGFAAQVAAVDAVVTIDNSALTTAAGLAKPVLALIAYSADWRWLYDRADSPWFPTVKLFRQDKPNDWSRAIARAADELHAVAAD